MSNSGPRRHQTLLRWRLTQLLGRVPNIGFVRIHARTGQSTVGPVFASWQRALTSKIWAAMTLC